MLLVYVPIYVCLIYLFSSIIILSFLKSMYSFYLLIYTHLWMGIWRWLYK